MPTLRVVTQPLVQSSTPGQAKGSPAQVPSAAFVRQWKLPNAEILGKDLQNLADRINAINTTLGTVSPTVSQILVTNDQGQVVAAVGNLTYQGVVYTNYFVELHAGDYFLTNDPTKAVFNVNTDGSVSIGDAGWIDVKDPYDGNAAWIGTQYDSLSITGAANNGAGLIRLTVIAHTLATGNTGVHVLGMQFAGVPNATGIWTVTSVDANHIDLQNSVWDGAFIPPSPTGGIQTQMPVIDRILQVTGASSNGGLIRLKFGVATGYESGTEVNVAGVGGVPNATGQWITSIPATLAITGAANNGAGLIRLTVPGQNFTTGDKPQILNVGGVPNADGYFALTVIDATHVDLQGSTFAGAYTAGGTISFLRANVVDLASNAQTGAASVFAGAYTSGGTCLQYFAGMLAETIAIGPSFANYKLRAFPSGDLRINNANIQLTSASGQIILNPTSTQISLTNFTNLSSIVLDATIPALTFRDQIGDPSVTLEILQEGPLAIASATNAAPTVLHVVGSAAAGYVNGDTVLIQGATGNTIINGYRIIESYDIPTETFQITDLQGNLLNANGAYAGAATSSRYYAGLLAQTLALGSSWGAYRLRFFADGTLKINRASIDQSTITNSTLTGSLTSVGGTAPNTVTLTISNGLLTIAGAGTAAGTGAITIDGLMTCGYLSLVGKATAPTAPGAGFADLYYDTVIGALRYNLAGSGWINISSVAASGAAGDIQFSDGAGGFTSSANLNYNSGLTQLTVPWLAVGALGITVANGGVTATLGNINAIAGVFVCQTHSGFSGTLAAAIAAGKNVAGGIIY